MFMCYLTVIVKFETGFSWVVEQFLNSIVDFLLFLLRNDL